MFEEGTLALTRTTAFVQIFLKISLCYHDIVLYVIPCDLPGVKGSMVGIKEPINPYAAGG